MARIAWSVCMCVCLGGQRRETINKAAGPSRPVPRSYRRAWRCAQAHAPGTGAHQAAKVCGGAGEGGRRCVRGLNREEMDHNEPGPSRCPPPPRCRRAPYRWLQRRQCVRAAVGWLGALGGGGEPRQLPSSPASPGAGAIAPKTEKGRRPGLTPTIIAPDRRSGAGRVIRPRGLPA